MGLDGIDIVWIVMIGALVIGYGLVWFVFRKISRK
jgi:hypothetical protein